MKKRLIALFLIIAVAMCCFSACGDKEEDPVNPKPGYDVVEDDNEAHYLIFMVEAIEVEKMLVVSTDTYENLEAYFPTVPEKDGYIGYWEDLRYVYLSTEKEIYINAYYVKK